MISNTAQNQQDKEGEKTIWATNQSAFAVFNFAILLFLFLKQMKENLIFRFSSNFIGLILKTYMVLLMDHIILNSLKKTSNVQITADFL